MPGSTATGGRWGQDGTVSELMSPVMEMVSALFSCETPFHEGQHLQLGAGPCLGP